MGTTGSGLWGGGGGAGTELSATKVSDLIYDALRRAGILKGPQRGASASEQADGLLALNRMLESWSIDRLNVYTIRIDSFTLSPSKQTYTIGEGGDFDAPRPIKITKANLIITSNAAQPLRHPIHLMTDEEWAAIKLQAVPSPIPLKLYNDGAFPLSTLYLWPYPSESYKLELYSWQALGQFTGTTDAVIFPPGYARAIANNLALELCAMFGVEPRATTIKLARDSKMEIESLNAPSPVLKCDTAILQGHRNSWNYLTGE